MLREHTQERHLVVPWIRLTERGRDIEAREILRVLKRAAADDHFIARLTEQGSKALRKYDLSRRAKAALMSGDIRWVEARVGKLNARLRTWFDCRLQQEIW
jgi:hypothetical protein